MIQTQGEKGVMQPYVKINKLCTTICIHITTISMMKPTRQWRADGSTVVFKAKLLQACTLSKSTELLISKYVCTHSHIMLYINTPLLVSPAEDIGRDFGEFGPDIEDSPRLSHSW